MKKITILFLFVAAIACKPDEEKSIGSRFDLSEGIDGAWELSSVEVVDLTLPIPEGRDITDFYTSQAEVLGITFNTTDQTYTIQGSETPSNPFGATGTYTLDDPDYPSTMILYTNTVDTVNLSLANMVRVIDPFMGYSLPKTNSCGENYASINYTFKRM